MGSWLFTFMIFFCIIHLYYVTSHRRRYGRKHSARNNLERQLARKELDSRGPGASSNPCLTEPCANKGTCTWRRDKSPSFSCICPLGFVGKLCDEQIPECSEQPCKHKGSCVATPTGFVCICKNGFDGFYCDDGENRKRKRSMKIGKNTALVITKAELKRGETGLGIVFGLLIMTVILLIVHFSHVKKRRDTMKEQYHILLVEKGVPPPLPPDTFEVSNLMCLEYFCCCCPKWTDSLKTYITALSKTTNKIYHKDWKASTTHLINKSKPLLHKIVEKASSGMRRSSMGGDQHEAVKKSSSGMRRSSMGGDQHEAVKKSSSGMRRSSMGGVQHNAATSLESNALAGRRQGHPFDGEQAKIHDETHQTQPQTMPSQLSSPVSEECVTSNRPTEMNLSWNPENFEMRSSNAAVGIDSERNPISIRQAQSLILTNPHSSINISPTRYKSEPLNSGIISPTRYKSEPLNSGILKTSRISDPQTSDLSASSGEWGNKTIDNENENMESMKSLQFFRIVDGIITPNNNARRLSYNGSDLLEDRFDSNSISTHIVPEQHSSPIYMPTRYTSEPFNKGMSKTSRYSDSQTSDLSASSGELCNNYKTMKNAKSQKSLSSRHSSQILPTVEDKHTSYVPPIVVARRWSYDGPDVLENRRSHVDSKSMSADTLSKQHRSPMPTRYKSEQIPPSPFPPNIQTMSPKIHLPFNRNFQTH